jgi:hypothetical protein
MDRELVDAAQVGTALAVLSSVALLAAVGLALGARSRRSDGLARGAWVAGIMALLGPGWWVYNAIEDHFGLDSVAALLINGALFVVSGIVIGLALRRFWPVSAANELTTGEEAIGTDLL